VGYFRETAHLIRVTAPGHDGTRAALAYDRILEYFKAARTQQRRIARLIKQDDLYVFRLTRGDGLSNSRLARPEAFSQVFTEIHFYFIAWHTIAESFKVLSRSSRLSCIKPLLSRHRQLLEHYSDGRDVLEHYGERLPGGKRVQNSGALDLGNLHGSNFTFGVKKWDVGPNSIEPLKTLVRQLEQEARREAGDKYQILRNTR
jgi:hypothetical protein